MKLKCRGGYSLRILNKILIISIVFLTISFYVDINKNDDKGVLLKNNSTKQMSDTSNAAPENKAGKPSAEKPKEGLSLLIGQDLQKLESELGKPQRIDPTIYGFDWYIYNLSYKRYVQVGVKGNRIVSVYAIGDHLNVAPFEIGQPLEEIFNTQYIDTNIDINLGGNSYRFELNDTDINLKPLIQLGNIYVQLYFDKFTGELSSVRFLDAETLIKQRPYELSYRGTLIEPKPNEAEWSRARDGIQREIFDLTNVQRQRHHLTKLSWDEKTAAVAYQHSKDMFDTNNFSHTSKTNGSLSERLKAAEIEYKSSGENIAANYSDGPEVVEGWLNSQGHRAAMLNKDFSDLGVGVYQKYYTQDFIQK